MDMIADLLLVIGALGAGLYCFVLSRRLKRFNDLEQGVGGAVAVLSAQVDDLNRSLQTARETSENSATSLQALTKRAEQSTHKLELMLASLHDLPQKSADHAIVGVPAEKPGKKQAEPMFVRHSRN